MAEPLPTHGLELRSRMTRGGELELSLTEVAIPVLQPGQVLVRVEAAPLNPSDLLLMLGPADMAAARWGGTAERPVVTAPLPAQALHMLAPRLDLSVSVGNEGAGVVVAAGEASRHLFGRTVAAGVGGMFTRYRVVKATNCLVMPDEVTPAEAASSIVNPMTALAMVGTLRLDGHKGLVHTAAASQLGQMLNRLCLADGVELVNIVRRPEQAALLRGQGARHVCDTSAESFETDLIRSLTETGATLAFDAIGGGPVAGQILSAMEMAANARAANFSRYGTASHKQVFVYGFLNAGPTTFTRDFGFAWSISGWILPMFLSRIEPQAADGLRARVIDELKTTFATRYTREISLTQALQPETIAAYAARATGEKFLLRPHSSEN